MYTNTYRTAQRKVKQFDSSYERNYQKRNQKFGIPLSCNTVIELYNPFKEKRGVFNTNKVDVTWRQSGKMLHYKHKADNIQLNKVCSGLLPKKKKSLQPRYANNANYKGGCDLYIFVKYMANIFKWQRWSEYNL